MDDGKNVSWSILLNVRTGGNGQQAMALGTTLCIHLMSGYHALMEDQQRAQPPVDRIIANIMTGEATDGMEAISLSQQVRPDAVLMDVYMPRMDGIEAARIIGMSSDTSREVASAFLSAGGRAFLPKEMVPTNLLEVIHRECSL
jgi:CheY-like chemotaxis protein